MAWDDFRRFSQVDLEPPKKMKQNGFFLDLISTNCLLVCFLPKKVNLDSTRIPTKKNWKKYPAKKKQKQKLVCQKNAHLCYLQSLVTRHMLAPKKVDLH